MQPSRSHLDDSQMPALALHYTASATLCAPAVCRPVQSQFAALTAPASVARPHRPQPHRRPHRPCGHRRSPTLTDPCQRTSSVTTSPHEPSESSNFSSIFGIFGISQSQNIGNPNFRETHFFIDFRDSFSETRINFFLNFPSQKFGKSRTPNLTIGDTTCTTGVGEN